MVKNPDQWVRECFKTWRDRGRHPSTAAYTVSLIGTTTTTITTAPDIHKEIVLNKEETTPETCKEMVLNKEEIAPKIRKTTSNKEGFSNLNGAVAVAVAVAADDDDNIDNAKSPPGCKNSMGDLDGIENEYYQVKENSKNGAYWNDDRNDSMIINDSPTHEINLSPRILDIHSTNITNDGEILSLPLFSPVYQVDNAKLQGSTLAVPITITITTTTAAPEIVSNKEVVSNGVVHTDLYSDDLEISNSEVVVLN